MSKFEGMAGNGQVLDCTVAPAELTWRESCEVALGPSPGCATAGKPTFLVAAVKDARSGNLDRIQIVKGWIGKDGKGQERVYDVAWGDADRRRVVRGKLAPVGNTVDTETATWTNTIGDPELSVVWTDPDFDPTVRAFYYARVVEIPTPRWTAYDAMRFGIKLPPEVPLTVQERAWASPICVSGTFCVNASAERTASWPVIASAT